MDVLTVNNFTGDWVDPVCTLQPRCTPLDTTTHQLTILVLSTHRVSGIYGVPSSYPIIWNSLLELSSYGALTSVLINNTAECWF